MNEQLNNCIVGLAMTQCEPIPEPRLSHLGQTALISLCDISNKLRCIEEFIDGPCSPILELGCPDNLLHNLKLIAEVSNNINERLDKLQEKL